MARLAAGLFLVHALLLGFSLGADARPMPLDHFGNPLCVTSEDGSGHGGPDGKGHPSGAVDCCALGCSMSGANLLPPPADVSILAPRPVTAVVAFVPSEDVGSGAVETPRKTRGPPLAI